MQAWTIWLIAAAISAWGDPTSSFFKSRSTRRGRPPATSRRTHPPRRPHAPDRRALTSSGSFAEGDGATSQPRRVMECASPLGRTRCLASGGSARLGDRFRDDRGGTAGAACVAPFHTPAYGSECGSQRSCRSARAARLTRAPPPEPLRCSQKRGSASGSAHQAGRYVPSRCGQPRPRTPCGRIAFSPCRSPGRR